jgi:glycosyltransferase involved in cell wall biosynthesis
VTDSGRGCAAFAAEAQGHYSQCVGASSRTLRGVNRSRGTTVIRPRAVYIGKSWISEPPGRDLEKKFAIHAQHLEQVVVAVGPRRYRRISEVSVLSLPAARTPFLGGILFYVLGPVIAMTLAAGRRRCVVVCQSPFEAFGVILVNTALPRRFRVRVQVELHGDWRTAARMYGSPLRGLIGPLSDHIAEWALRRADKVRVVSQVLEDLARQSGYRGPIDRYITFSDYSTFLDDPPAPLPAQPRVTFVGVLERYKAVDILIEAWQGVVDRVPEAILLLVGEGSLGGELRKRVQNYGLERSVFFHEQVTRSEVRLLIDNSTCLVLPSRSEGLPRVVVEAMARGRPVVASTVGGMGELIHDGHNGLLVPPEDVVALSDALVGVLKEPDVARAMGQEARRRAEARLPLAEYSAGIERLAAWISE